MALPCPDATVIDGRLFTRDFLLEGIRETAAWAALDDITVSPGAVFAEAMLTVAAGSFCPHGYPIYPNALAAGDPDAEVVL